MEQYGHLELEAEIKQSLLLVSAATIDRLLSKVRESAKAKEREVSQPHCARSIPVRTFADWKDPAPGFVEADLVRAEGYEVLPEDVARLSPLSFKHINVLGRYAFTLPDTVARGELRPLRDPNTASLDEA